MSDRTTRKTRTREHIIADLSFHHLARLVVREGFTVEAFGSDYGYDLTIYTFDEQGEYENGNIFVQLKATDHIKVLSDGRIAFQLDRRDIATWEGEVFPVYLVVFDAAAEQAYALDLGHHLRASGITSATMPTAAVTVHLQALEITGGTMREWRSRKNDVLAQLKAVLP